MAPSTTSASQSSPLQEPTHPKRNLRNRGSNSATNSNQNEVIVVESDRLGGVGDKMELDGDQIHGGDARGKFLSLIPSPRSYRCHTPSPFLRRKNQSCRSG